MKSLVPLCGESDERNDEYLQEFSPEKYYKSLVKNSRPVILDIGAHHGESVRFFKGLFPNSNIISFEPDPDNYRILKSVCQEYSVKGGCAAINKGMGDKEGVLPFYKQTISHLGSLLPVNTSSVDSIGYAANAKNKPIQVDITTLDRFCSEEKIDRIDILKIDVQGYEVGVLRGASSILKKTRCCTVEVSLFDFYEQSSSLLQVEKPMQHAGHSLWDISKISKNPKNFRTDWVELVYINNNVK